MAFAVVRTFLSGSVLPLWFMPGWLQAIAAALPFQAATYTPLAIYFGRAARRAGGGARRPGAVDA